MLFAGAAMSQAAVLVDQDPTTGPDGGAWQDMTGAQLIVDSFTLTQSSVITEYDGWGSSPQAASYNLVLYADTGGSGPGAALVTLSSIQPTSFGVGGAYGGNAAVFGGLSINVNAGTKYWIGISGNGSDFGTYSTNPCSTGDGILAFESTPAGPWNVISSIGDMTYELQGNPVPEPASMAVLGLGFLALIRKRARR